MNRIHPEDLRAELAMRFYELASSASNAGTRDQTVKWAVESSDTLLAELARTAKPGLERFAERLDEFAQRPEMFNLTTERDEAIARAEKAEATALESMRLGAEIDKEKCELARQLAKAEADLATAKAEGAKEERERIIALLANDPFTGLCVLCLMTIPG